MALLALLRTHAPFTRVAVPSLCTRANVYLHAKFRERRALGRHPLEAQARLLGRQSQECTALRAPGEGRGEGGEAFRD